jgi:hypothetical protein
MVKFNIKLSSDDYSELGTTSQFLECTMAELIRLALDIFLTLVKLRLAGGELFIRRGDQIVVIHMTGIERRLSRRQA